MSVVDNTLDFESIIKTLIWMVTRCVDIEIGDRLALDARKFKFVINGPLPADEAFPEGFRDFEVLLLFCTK